MPLQQGEVCLLTLFADVHYYFSPPTQKPVHHRFDKASYVYLYHDAINKRGRLEIANHAGTAEQDAFSGFLDESYVEHSHKRPTQFTVTVDSRKMNGASPPQQDTSQWHLPGHDMRNETKYMYKLHTLDIYFWTTDDGHMFLDSLKRCLQPQQIRVLDATAVHSEHRDSMSPVVQKLEKAAISTPQYAEPSSSASTARSSSAPRSSQTPVSPISTPPTSGVPASYAPMAYDPAAPGEPEPIAHREKTPPPADAHTGTGLDQAAVHEHGTHGFAPQPGLQHQGSFPVQQQQQQLYMPGPPQQPPPPQQLHRTSTQNSLPPPPPQQQAQYHSGSPASQQGSQYSQGFAPPPPQDANAHIYGQQQQPQPGIHRQSTMPQQYYASQQAPLHQPISPPAHQQSFSPQPTTQYANYQPMASAVPNTSSYQHSQPPTPGYNPQQHQPPTPGYQPGTPGYGPQPSTPGYGPPHQQPQQPMGGYSQYNYSTQQQPQTQQEQYNIHQQAYRPTESEAHGKMHAGQPQQAGPGMAGPGRAEQGLAKVEKGIGRFMKKLDKRL